MIPLAFNIDGEAFELPPTAVGWRVKRLRQGKGAPELVYGSDGVPLVVSLDVDIEELRRIVVAPGKYRLDPVDDQHRVIKSAEVAYVLVRASEPSPTTSEATVPDSSSPNAMAVVIEAMRQNSEAMKQNAEMARTIVDRFPSMLEAAAVLIKAADGAGLPAREPQRKERDEDAEDDDGDQDDNSGDEQASVLGLDLNALIAQLVPGLLTAISKGDLKLPNLAEMLDWRRAAASAAKGKAPPCESAGKAPPCESAGKAPPSGSAGKAPPSGSAAKAPHPPTAKPQTSETTAEATAAPEPPADAATDAKLPPLSPQAMLHFLAIQSALTPDEATLARAAAAQLSSADRRAWIEQLSAMTVPEAVERVRELLAASTPAEAA